MKYLKHFKELNEKISPNVVGDYYHATSFGNTIKILDADIMEGKTVDSWFQNRFKDSTKYKDMRGISLTRNKNFVYDEKQVMFIIDGEKVKFGNNKVIPTDWFTSDEMNIIKSQLDDGMIDKKEYDNYIKGIEHDSTKDEFEDFVVGNLKPFHKFLKGIIIIGNTFDLEETIPFQKLIKSKIIKKYVQKYNLLDNGFKLYYTRDKNFKLNDLLKLGDITKDYL